MKHTYPKTYTNCPQASCIKHVYTTDISFTALAPEHYQFHTTKESLLNLRYLPQTELQNQPEDKEVSGHCSAPTGWCQTTFDGTHGWGGGPQMNKVWREGRALLQSGHTKRSFCLNSLTAGARTFYFFSQGKKPNKPTQMYVLISTFKDDIKLL